MTSPQLTKPPLPSWAVSRCDWCGEQMWDGSCSHTVNGERVHTHGFDRSYCEQADQRTERDLKTEYVLAHQALIAAAEYVGRWISESDDSEYEDPKALQTVLWGVQSIIDRGIEGMRHYDVERAK